MTLDVFIAIAIAFAIAIILLGVNIFFRKNGKFPSGHVSDVKKLKDSGVSCAKTQDKEAQEEDKK